MNGLLIWTLQNARRQTLNLVEDLNEGQIFIQSIEGENHPAWILGHLLLGDVYLLSLLKIQPLGEDFPELLDRYGPASTPVCEFGFYHSKQTLVERLPQTNWLKLDKIGQMTQTDLAQPTPDNFLAQAQPTIEHHLLALAVHEAHHGGQLSAWRKSQGLKSVKWAFAP